MADKNLNFNITVNNKQLDLTKTSFKDFQKIINQAKTDLKGLPLTDPRYKTLNADIKAAEKAWKEATKAANEFGDEQEEGEGKVKSYAAQIRAAKTELVSLEQQFGKNSQQYVDQQNKIKSLADAQEELTRGTQKLDDALSNIPGPIGQVGQGLQQFENVTQSAKSAMSSLTEQFPLLKNAFVASGIGAIVILIGLLVAAVMDAAKSFKPLQDAFAGIKDAVGAFFNALKPITDFILNIFVGAINGIATAINFVAEAFGGVSNNVNKTTLELERDLAKIGRTYGAMSESVGVFTKSIIDNQLEAKKAILEVNKALKDKLITDREAVEQEYLILLNSVAKKEKLEIEYLAGRADRDQEIKNLEAQNNLKAYTNERKLQKDAITVAGQNDRLVLANQRTASSRRIEIIDNQIASLKKLNITGGADIIKLLQSSKEEEEVLVKYYEQRIVAIRKGTNAEITKLNKEFNREDTALIKERSLAAIQAGAELIKNEYEKAIQIAKIEKDRLIEQQRLETEANTLAGATSKNLKEKQLAELNLANEKIRLAQVQQNAYLYQLEIDTAQRLIDEGAEGTQLYYEHRRTVIEQEFQKELILADNNMNMTLNARTKYYKQLTDLDIQQAQTEADLMQRKADTIGLINQTFYDGQIASENARYDADVKAAKDNYDLIEVLTAEHNQRLRDIDVAALEAKKQIELAKYAIVAQIGSLLQQLAGKNKDIAIAGVLIEKAAAIGQIWANNAIANAKATAASPLKFGQPWVTINTVSAALSTAATIAAAVKAVNQIKEAGSGGTGTSGTGGAAGAAMPNYGRNYEDGGLIGGRRHAQGGTMIEAEQGEAIMTRGAVTMFTPMLSMMNQMGGGTSFINNVGGARPDNPTLKNPALQQEPLILKTYVVSNELTTEAQKQARLKDLSTL
jgi:hypothetical protein